MHSDHCGFVVQSERTRQRQVGRLLDDIPTRGANAFPELIRALVETEQEFLAKMLDADLTHHFQNAEPNDQPVMVDVMEVDSAADSEKSISEKVSEIRMFLSSAFMICKLLCLHCLVLIHVT